MDKIEWSDKFSVGISFLDEQHKRIIDMINKLIEGSNNAFVSESVTETLRSMIKYALTHFEDEESLMIKHGYPGYTNHKEQHKIYKIKAVSFHTATPVKEELMSVKLLEFLKNWWVHHIIEEDMKYKEFYKKNGLLNKINIH